MASLPHGIRQHHYHHATVVPVRAEDAGPLVERCLTMPLSDEAVSWTDVMPNEAPARTRYWPRLTVAGTVRLGGNTLPIELTVWPWDVGACELGLAPRVRHPATLDHDAWPVFAVALLRRLAGMIQHPALTGDWVPTATHVTRT